MMFAHRVMKNVSYKLILSLAALFVSFSACRPNEQLGGMYELKFDEMAVCSSVDKVFQFQNNSDQPLTILGIKKSAGSDTRGNFSFRSIIIGAEDRPSISGALNNITIPPHTPYALKLRFSPTPLASGKEVDAYVDMAISAPRQGVIQLYLHGSASASTVTSCSSTDTTPPVEVGFDGEMDLRIEKVIAATSAISSPINTDQGQFDFVDVNIPIRLNRQAGTVFLPAYTSDLFVLPPPTDDVPGIGGLIKGSLVVRIPEEKTGTYNSSTGSISIPNVRVTMTGSQDFSADLVLTLTTGRLAVNTIRYQPDSALEEFGSPTHAETNIATGTKEIFGSNINAGGKVFLVGLTDLSNITYARGISTTLRGGLSSGAGMAILLEGTLHTRN